MAFYYKDFNKAATDAYKTGKANKYTMKFCHKRGGVTYEGEGSKGGAHGFTLKGKGGSILDVLGFNLDELNVSDGKSYNVSHKWSNSGLIPDAKIKATISQPWQNEHLAGGHFNPIPSSLKLAVEYGSGPIKASTAAKFGSGKEAIAALGMPVVDADLVFNAGDLNVGASLQVKDANIFDYNLAAKYAMGDMSAVLQANIPTKVVNFSLHNQFDSNLQVAATSTYTHGEKSKLEQVLGGQYKIDGATTGALNLKLGNLFDFKAENVSIVASVAQSASLGKTTAALSYKNGESPSFGMKFETKA